MQFSATLYIEPNGSVTVAGILGQNGNTYTLLAPYTGSIEDERNGSTLVGASQLLTVSNGSAGVLVLRASDVSVT